MTASFSLQQIDANQKIREITAGISFFLDLKEILGSYLYFQIFSK
jgi:hypothetical protein